MDQGGSVMETLLDKAGTLRAQEHGHQPLVLTTPGGTDYLTGWDCQEKRVFTPNGVAPTLSGSDGGGGRTGCGYIFVPICMATQQGGAEVRCDNKDPTLTAAAGMSGNNQPVVLLTFPADVANTQLTKAQLLSHRMDEDNFVLSIGGFSYKQGGKAKGIGFEEEKSPTLSAERHDASVVIAKVYDTRGNRDGETEPTLTEDHKSRATDYTAIVLDAKTHDIAAYVHQNQLGEVRTAPVAGTLNTNSNATGRNAPLVFVVNQLQSEAVSFDMAQVTSKTNQSKGSVGVAYSLAKTGQPAVITTTEDGTILVDGQPCVLVKLLVRRLTPLECERLQGYPDGWTVLPPIEDMSDYEYDFWRRFLLEKAEREGKARANKDGTYTIWRKTETKNEDGETVETWEDTGKPYKHKTRERMVAWYNKSFASDTDGSRYMALGNSIALPPWKWVLKRIAARYERDATMASLFDGIGGFPLLWEQLNGKGTCLWASEIEAFPVAVTRYRFGEENDGDGPGKNHPQGRGNGAEAAVCGAGLP